MRLGRISLAHPFTLAPLEEHSSLPFRLLARRQGASLVWTERLDAADVAVVDRRARKLLGTVPHEAPRGAQLCGRDPAVLAEAARQAVAAGFDLVDLNCDCPVRRVVGAGAGGALMAEPERIGHIVAALVAAVPVPVTVKLRSGPDPATCTAPDAARLAAEAGATAISIHARSVAQGYAGEADWTVIATVKAAVSIPVLGGGSIRTAADAVRMLRQTGADGVAIGRGALGQPWIFRLARALWNGAPVAPPSLVERGRILLDLVDEELRFYGRPLGLRRLPRTACYFAKDLPDFPAFRREIQQVRDLEGLRRLVKSHFG